MTSGRFSNNAIDRLNGIGCIDHPTDILRVVKHRDEMIPMTAPLLGNHRILILPIRIKLFKGFQGLLSGGRLINRA